MKHEDLAKLAMDTQDFVCYILEIESCKILYMNETARVLAQLDENDDYTKYTCYKILHNKSTPCTICNNNTIQVQKRATREMKNEVNNIDYSFVDTYVEVDGKPCKIAFGFDSSKQRKEFEEFTRKLSFEETLIRCIQTLIEDVEVEQAISNLLSIVGEFYQADRAYIFEVDNDKNISINTYEWSLKPQFATMHSDPILKLDGESQLLERFINDGKIAIYNPETELDHNSDLYRILVDTDTTSALLVPIFEQGILTSFIGVDNPKRMTKDLSLLHSVAIFIADDMKKRKLFKQLEHLSYTDLLTGLDNRNKYVVYLEQLEPRKLTSLGFIHATVNGLKKINELYGEQRGDAILKQVAIILKEHLRGELFRLSGDEFIALCPNISQEEFEDIIAVLRKKESETTEFSFAVGGTWQDKKIDIHQGLNQAGEIMYAEKQNFYKAKLGAKVQSRANSVEIILDEIRSGCFSIYLQPKVNLNTGEIAGAEALIRKHNNSGKLVPPDRFIPIYENEGTIRHLDFFVLEEVCKVQKNLIEENRPLKIAVNFSRVTFIAYDFIDEIIKTCAKYDIPHEYIKIEITESIDKMDIDFFNKKLKNLKEAGFEISLDDFGAKHSNLLMLTTNEFSEVKVDKGLIDNIAISSQNRTLVRNIIRLIKELGTSTCVAEGIETKEQKERLQDFGCSYGQGYYFYRPMPVNEFLLTYKTNEKIEKLEIASDGVQSVINYNPTPEEMSEILDAMPLAMNLWNHKRENIMCNQHAVELFDLEQKSDYLLKFFLLSPERQPDGRLSSEAALYYINEARNHGFVRFNWLHCKINGEEIPAEITLHRLDMKAEEGDQLIAGFTRDLRPQLAGDNRTESAEDYFFNEISNRTLFQNIAELSAEWFWAYNNTTKHIQFFGKGREILQLSADKVPFPSAIVEAGMVYDDDVETFLSFSDAMEKGANKPVEVRFILPDGSVQYFKIVYKTIYDSNDKPLFSIGKTYSIHNQKHLEILSQTDQLTSCLNKSATENYIRNILQLQPDLSHTLFIFDIDNFKSINDNFGHHFGDLVLAEIAKELQSHFRGADIIGRIGGDEFVIFLKNTSNINIISEKAKLIGKTLKKSYIDGNTKYKISGSIGISIFSQDASNFEDLYIAADKALYQSKSRGKDCFTFYTEELKHGSMQQLTALENADRLRNNYLDADFEMAVYEILQQSEDTKSAINKAIHYIGKHLNVDRSYIFETPDSGKTYGVTYEWTNEGISPQKNNLQSFPRESLGEFFNALCKNDVVYSNNITLEECKDLYGLVKDQGIKSFLFVQAKGTQYPRLVFGLDDCTVARKWGEKEINSMRNLVKMLSVFTLTKKYVE